MATARNFPTAVPTYDATGGGFDDMFAEGSAKAADDLASRPPVLKKQEPSFSTWGLVRGVAKSIPAGVSEVVGSTFDTLKAYGQVSAGLPDNTSLFDTPAQQKKRSDALDKVMQYGPDFNSDEGRSFRNVAQGYMPDPATAHTSEIMVAEFGRVMTKAIGSTVLTGSPIPAAIEEGFTTSDKLGQQGVDMATRTGVGAVTAAANAVAFGLPVAGPTLKATIGLGAVSGPATFVAQEAATKHILEKADYDQLAAQHDPFDPAGLTLATLGALIPGGLTHYMRGRSAAQAARVAAEAVPAELPARTAVARAVDEMTVDAARVQVLRDVGDRARLTPADDLAGAAAHRQAMEVAGEQLARGEPVDVLRTLPESTLTQLDRHPQFVEFVGKVEETVAAAKPPAQPGVWFSSSTVRDLQVLDPAKARDGNLYGPAVYMARDQQVSATYARGGLDQKTGERLPDGQVYAAEFEPTKPFDADRTMSAKAAAELAKAMGADSLPGLEGRPRVAGSTLYKELTKALGGKAAVNKALAAQGYDAIMFKQRGAELMAALREVTVKQHDEGAAHATPAEAPRVEAPASARSTDGAAAPADVPAAGRAGDAQAAGVVAEATPAAGRAAELQVPPEHQAVHDMATQLEQTHAHMEVELEGMPRMTVAELMDTIRTEVAQDLSEVPLVQAAATCFITNGGAL